jgi:hypothetical protein
MAAMGRNPQKATMRDSMTSEGRTSGVFLVPTPLGAGYATSSDDPEPRRRVLLALLRGGANRPAPLGEIAQLAGLADRRAAAVLMFGMQREGWVSGDVAPLATPHGPTVMLLPQLLAQVCADGVAVLADASGLCVAFSGVSRDQAEALSAHVASLDPRLRRMADDKDGWGLAAGKSGERLAVRPLCVDRFRFLLVLGSGARTDSESYIHLVAVLARHCLGEFGGGGER